MISVQHLSKSYDNKRVVDDLAFEVQAGKVTGFLGPNGSGKSTTFRLILGLDLPDAGTALINNLQIRDLKRPMREVGFLLDADYVHPSRSAKNHLRALAASNGISAKRVAEVIEAVGLSSVASKRLNTYSLGMKQRVGLAAAMLGDPPVLILDEPANGLDPEGAYWLREHLRSCAAEGRTVFVSSHVLSDMALIVDHLVVIGEGKLLADSSIEDFTSKLSTATVVRSPRASEFAEVLLSHGTSVRINNDELEIDDLTPAQVGHLAFKHGLEIHGLWSNKASLERAFLDLTSSKQQFQSVLPKRSPHDD